MPPIIISILSTFAANKAVDITVAKAKEWSADLGRWLKGEKNAPDAVVSAAKATKSVLDAAAKSGKGQVKIEVPASTQTVLSGVLAGLPPAAGRDAGAIFSAKTGRGAGSIRAVNVSLVPCPKPYYGILGQLLEGAQIMVYGLPGQGKSYWLLQMAKFFANYYGPVQVLRLEEADPTLKLKLDELNITDSDNITFVDRTEYRNSKGYKVVIVDSVQSLDDFGGHTIREMKSKYPSTIFIYVVQTTKEGDARGSNTWPHEVDAVYKVVNRTVYWVKSRYGGSGSAPVVSLEKKTKVPAIRRLSASTAPEK